LSVPTKNPLRWLALVAIDEPRLPPAEEIVDALRQNFNEASQLICASSTENLHTFIYGEHTVAVALVPQPIPWSQLEGPCATAWYWPDAADALRDQAAHLMVTLVDEGGRPIAKSRRLTEFVTAIASTCAARGIFWGPGRLVHQPEAFIDQARQMTVDNLPLFLWIDFRIERLAENISRLFTTGLAALGGIELEVGKYHGEPQALVDYVYNVAHYQLDQQKMIKDGERIGLTDQLQATANLRPSMLNKEMEVILLDFEATGE